MKDRILFVDDELEVLDGLQRSMRKMRDAWDVEFCSGAEEALIALEQRPFDVVVTDLRMPKMNGMELLAQLAGRYPRVGRIILTAALDRESVAEGRELAQDYLVKPCNSEMLIAIIKVRLGIERLTRSRERPAAGPEKAAPLEGRALLNLNEAVENAVATTRLEWLDVADVVTELDPHLHPIRCAVAEVRMVILNMIVNAAHAVAQSAGGGGPKGKIRIRTQQMGPSVRLQLDDPVTRIPESARAKVFDPTHDWDAGPGPWLAVAHEVVRQHGGSFSLESLPDRGTSFSITLPE